MSLSIFGKVPTELQEKPATSQGQSVSTLGPYSESKVKELLSVQQTVPSQYLQNTVQLPNPDARKELDLVPQGRPIEDSKVKPHAYSSVSGPVPFETLFHEFELEAFPFYNFWVHDEKTNDRDALGNRKLEDVPRFIKISWRAAPDLQDPEERIRPKPVDVRPLKQVMLSREIERPGSFNHRGINFSPAHLDPKNFSKIKGIICNGFLAPGVVEAVVELPIKNTDVKLQTGLKIDEDAFLLSPKTAGLSIHEMVGQQQTTQNYPVIGTPTENQLVENKYVASYANGKVSIASVHPSSPSLSFTANVVSSVDPNEKVVSDVVKKSDVPADVQLKVKFFNPSIGGIVDSTKVNLMSAPEHAENLAALAPSLGNLEVLAQSGVHDLPRQVDLPSLPSPKIKPLEYVGYVIEKYARGDDGSFKKIDEFDVPSRESDFIIDTKVLYGEVYRYRIKTILRWTRPRGDSFGSQAGLIATHKSSYIASEWSKRWAYAACVDTVAPPPPDELTVRPESHRKRVVITFRLPENSQRDIVAMRLLKKVQDKDGRDLSSWEEVDREVAPSTLDFAPANNIYFDDNVSFFQDSGLRYVYAAQTITKHGEESLLSEQLSCRLNGRHFAGGEFPVEFVSSAGVSLVNYGAFTTIPPRLTKTEIVVAPPPARMGNTKTKTSVVFSGRNTLGTLTMDGKTYVCRVQSLDTGESIDIPLAIRYNNQPVRQDVSTQNVLAFPGLETLSVSQPLVQKPAQESVETEVRDQARPGERW